MTTVDRRERLTLSCLLLLVVFYGNRAAKSNSPNTTPYRDPFRATARNGLPTQSTASTAPAEEEDFDTDEDDELLRDPRRKKPQRRRRPDVFYDYDRPRPEMLGRTCYICRKYCEEVKAIRKPKLNGYTRLEGQCEKGVFKDCTHCTFDICHQMCAKDDRCNSFTYRFVDNYEWCRLNRKTCKQSDVYQTPENPPAWATYNKPQIIPKDGYPMLTNFQRYPGSCKRLGRLRFCMNCNTLEKCAAKCNNIGNCVGFLYNFRQGTCLPKDTYCNIGDREYVPGNAKYWEAIRFYKKRT